ncbi:MAG: hypothetical protein ACTSQO_07630 [Candidatus Helarchaeota archaeon]
MVKEILREVLICDRIIRESTYFLFKVVETCKEFKLEYCNLRVLTFYQPLNL